MSKAKKSQFDTPTIRLQKNSTALTAALILFFSTIPAPAAQKCEVYFANSFVSRLAQPIKALSTRFGFKPKNSIVLSPQQIKDLDSFISSTDFQRPHGMGRGNSPMFWYLWEMTPPSVKETLTLLIEQSPQELRKLRANINSVLEKNNISQGKQDSFFELILSQWGDQIQFKESNLPFSEWAQRGYEKYLDDIRLNNISVIELKQKYEIGLQYKKANQFWDTQAGVKVLNIKRIDNQDMIEINGSSYKCQIDATNKSIKILVPRERVKLAAWNPLYTEVLTKKIAEGARPLKFYDGFLAANAYFYLSDGNHRFHIDTRTEVWIQMSYPAKTASYRVSFDAMGIRQPEIEALHKFNNGDATLSDLIGAEAAKHFVFH